MSASQPHAADAPAASDAASVASEQQQQQQAADALLALADYGAPHATAAGPVHPPLLAYYLDQEAAHSTARSSRKDSSRHSGSHRPPSHRSHGTERSSRKSSAISLQEMLVASRGRGHEGSPENTGLVADLLARMAGDAQDQARVEREERERERERAERERERAARDQARREQLLLEVTEARMAQREAEWQLRLVTDAGRMRSPAPEEGLQVARAEATGATPSFLGAREVEEQRLPPSPGQWMDSLPAVPTAVPTSEGREAQSTELPPAGAAAPACTPAVKPESSFVVGPPGPPLALHSSHTEEPQGTGQTITSGPANNPSVVPSSSSAPVVVVRQQTPVKPFDGRTDWKSWRANFQRACTLNGWVTAQEQAQHLALALDGPAADLARGVEDADPHALDTLWTRIERRYGRVDGQRNAKRQFETRRQSDSESLPEYELALTLLHQEAWPLASAEEKDASLKRRFEEGVASLELVQYLRVHCASLGFAETVKRARVFLDALEMGKPRKTVRMLEGQGPSSCVNQLQGGNDPSPLVKEMIQALTAALKPLVENRAPRPASPAPHRPEDRGRPPTRPSPLNRGWGNGPPRAGSLGRYPPSSLPRPGLGRSRSVSSKRPCFVCGHPQCHSSNHSRGRVGFQSAPGWGGGPLRPANPQAPVSGWGSGPQGYQPRGNSGWGNGPRVSGAGHGNNASFPAHQYRS